MGFYTSGAIQNQFASFDESHIEDNVSVTEEAAGSFAAVGSPAGDRFAQVVRTLIGEGHSGETVQIVLLSRPDDAAETITLPYPIAHRRKGRGSAWTMGQRYVALSCLTELPALTDTLELDRRLKELASSRSSSHFASA